MAEEIYRLVYEAPSNEDIPAVEMPPSKSVMARLLLIGAAAGVPPVRLTGGAAPLCDDLEVMSEAAQMVFMAMHGGRYVPPSGEIDIRASGTAKRLLAAWFACMPEARVVLRQSDGLARRPLHPLPEMLALLGAGTVEEEDGLIHISGRAPVGTARVEEVAGGVSSQFFTALMLPAFCMPSGLKLRLLPPVVSAPYIDMTARLLAACGIQARFSMNTGELSVSTGRPVPPGPELAEADWSSASYIYEYVALSRRPVLVRGLRGGSLQGDSRCMSLFLPLGVRSTQAGDHMLLEPCVPSATSVACDMRSTPDLVPALVVTCAMLGIRVRITGVSHLRVKECDRLKALAANLGMLGIRAAAGDDSLDAEPGILSAPDVPLPVYSDHRMAMAFAVAAVRLPGLAIEDPVSVNKSFPGFWREMALLGLKTCVT